MLIRFNKPYGVLSQFTPEGRWQGLSDYLTLPEFRVAGRLDADSEGLLLLTDNGALQARIAEPRHKLPKCYWAQVEGIPDEAALAHTALQYVALKGVNHVLRDDPTDSVANYAKPGPLSPQLTAALDQFIGK